MIVKTEQIILSLKYLWVWGSYLNPISEDGQWIFLLLGTENPFSESTEVLGARAQFTKVLGVGTCKEPLVMAVLGIKERLHDIQQTTQ